MTFERDGRRAAAAGTAMGGDSYYKLQNLGVNGFPVHLWRMTEKRKLTYVPVPFTLHRPSGVTSKLFFFARSVHHHPGTLPQVILGNLERWHAADPRDAGPIVSEIPSARGAVRRPHLFVQISVSYFVR